jgi:hypothetical protein
MKNSGTYIYRLVAGAIAMLLLTTSASAQTQWDLNHAVECCWAIDNGFCSTPLACATGAQYCKSEEFLNVGFPKEKLECSAMFVRGDNDGAIRLFEAPAPITTSDGQTLEVSSEVASSLRTATKVMQLQSRGASSEELKAVASDDVKVSVEDSEDGGRAITVRGEGTDDIVLRYDANGEMQKGDDAE